MLLLLHGNIVTADDFRANGLMEQLSRSFRVIAIDRPGFGYSDRPRGQLEAAAALAQRYGELRMPVLLMAGENDRVIDPQSHTARLHKDVPHSELTLLPDVGHMVQHLAQNDIVHAVKDLAGRAGLSAPVAGNGAARSWQEAPPV